MLDVPNMHVTIDTNVLLRFLTRDDLVRASIAKKLLDQEKSLSIPEVVFPEIEYILRKIRKQPKKIVIEAFGVLSTLNNIKLTKQTHMALKIYSKTNLDMADCLIAAHSLKGKLASFDQELLRVENVNPFWKK